MDEWAKGDLYKVYEAIWSANILFEERNLKWNLDTVYRFLPDLDETRKKCEREEKNNSEADALEAYERRKTKEKLEKYLDYKLTNENSSIEFSGSNLSAGFYQQLRNSLVAAFLLMSWVVFFIFGGFVRIFLNGFWHLVHFLGSFIAHD